MIKPSLNIVLASAASIQSNTANKVISANGYNVIPAAIDKGLINLLEAGNIDLIIFDMDAAPNIVLNIARDIKNKANISPLLYLAALASEQSDNFVRKCFEAGINNYILKPLTSSKLLAVTSLLNFQMQKSKNQL